MRARGGQKEFLKPAAPLAPAARRLLQAPHRESNLGVLRHQAPLRHDPVLLRAEDALQFDQELQPGVPPCAALG